jgi:hypothetical protein
MYTPPHLWNNGNGGSIWDEKPTISLVAIIGKMESRTLKLTGSIKNKNNTILVDSKSTQFRGYQSCETTKPFCIPCEGSHC